MISQYWLRRWLGAVRQQAITWANVDPDLCHLIMSLGHNELNCWEILNPSVTLYILTQLERPEQLIPHPAICLSNYTELDLSLQRGWLPGYLVWNYNVWWASLKHGPTLKRKCHFFNKIFIKLTTSRTANDKSFVKMTFPISLRIYNNILHTVAWEWQR